MGTNTEDAPDLEDAFNDVTQTEDYKKLYAKYSDPAFRAPTVPIRGTDQNAPYLSSAKQAVDEITGQSNSQTEWKSDLKICSWCQGDGKVKVTSNFIVRDVYCEKCDGEGVIWLRGKPKEPEPEPVKNDTRRKQKPPSKRSVLQAAVEAAQTAGQIGQLEQALRSKDFDQVVELKKTFEVANARE